MLFVASTVNTTMLSLHIPCKRVKVTNKCDQYLILSQIASKASGKWDFMWICKFILCNCIDITNALPRWLMCYSYLVVIQHALSDSLNVLLISFTTCACRINLVLVKRWLITTFLCIIVSYGTNTRS